MILGALEAGGTKMVCAVGDEKGNILDCVSIPTEKPSKTLERIGDYFADKNIEALGIGCFGPLDLNMDSPTYGFITSTPKPFWGNVDVVGYFKKRLLIPIGFDTDVNASCIGESVYGSSKGLSDIIYITIGTGIGIGVISNGNLLHGAMHPEGGHIFINRDARDGFMGVCPYHKNCFEGLSSGIAVGKRFDVAAKDMSDDDPFWDIEANYIAQALLNYTMVLSPQRIILGGGVMHNVSLLDKVKAEFVLLNNGYISNSFVNDIDNYIILQSLEDKQGILGALALAHRSLL